LFLCVIQLGVQDLKYGPFFVEKKSHFIRLFINKPLQNVY